MPGRHRRPMQPADAPPPAVGSGAAQPPPSRRSRGWLAPVAAVLAIVVGTPVAYAVVRERDADAPAAEQCSRTHRISATVAPDLEPVIGEVAARLLKPQSALGGACLAVSVNPVESAAVTQTLMAAETPSLPDVWIPDSSMWADLAAASGPGSTRVPTGARPSVASSPLVIAMHRANAVKRGWPAKQISWKGLIREQGDDAALPAVRLELPDPLSSTVGLSTLSAVLGPSDDPYLLAQLTRRMNTPAVELDGKLPQGYDRFLGRAATEQWVWRQAVGEPTAPFVAVAPAEGAPANDYPFVALRVQHDDPQTYATAVELLQQAVAAADAKAVLHRHGFRAPDGSALPAGGTPDIGSSAKPTTKVPSPGRTQRLLGAWTKASRAGRVLALIDVSGSMGVPVPGTGRTKLQLALAGAGEALGAFDDNTELGIWVFSTNLVGNTDYRTVVPITGVGQTVPGGGTVRQAIKRSLPSLQPKKMGGTGLYDSTLAGYRTVKRSYDPRRLNTLVVLTDGRNEDESGLSRAAFFAALKREVDPRRPVRIIPIAYGAGADYATLKAMADLTGGRLHVSRDPRDINVVVWSALTAL